MKGFRPGGRRKSGAERAEIGGNLPRGHPCHAFQRPKKPGKTGRYAEEIGCEIGKLSDRENRRLSVPDPLSVPQENDSRPLIDPDPLSIRPLIDPPRKRLPTPYRSPAPLSIPDPPWPT